MMRLFSTLPVHDTVHSTRVFAVLALWYESLMKTKRPGDIKGNRFGAASADDENSLATQAKFCRSANNVRLL